MEAPKTVAPARCDAHERRNRHRPLTYRELTRLAALLDRCVSCGQVDLVTPFGGNVEFGVSCDGDGMSFAPVVHDGGRTGNSLEIALPTNVLRQLAAALD